jgi:hypothetical protein
MVCRFELELTLGVILYITIISYTIIIYYYTLLLLYIYYIVIYYYLILYSSFPLSSFLLLPLFLSSFSSIFLLNHPLLPPVPHSFYTCRYLHILIYIQSGYLSSLLQFSSSLPSILLPFPSIFYHSHPNPTIRPRTNYRRDVSSGVVLFVWCSVLVEGYLAFELVLTCGVYCVIILLYIISYLYSIRIYYTIHYYYIIILILYSPILLIYLQFCSPLLFNSLLFQSSPHHPRNTCRYLHILIYIHSFPIFHLSIFSSDLFLLPHSFYTCRYLHILIYISSQYSQTSYLSILKGYTSILCLG